MGIFGKMFTHIFSKSLPNVYPLRAVVVNMGKHLANFYLLFANICDPLRLPFSFSEPPASPIPTPFPLFYWVFPILHQVEMEGIPLENGDTQ